MSSPQRYPTNDELDYERRKEQGFPGLGVPGRQSRGVVSELQTQFAVEGNDTSAYIGVTQERMTYANETEKPLAADGGVEQELEERLLKQPVLVAPVQDVDGNQTDGGGSSQEPVYTALSGENFSAEVAKPPTTEKVDASETTAGPTDDSGQVEVGVSGGSTGETVSEAENQRLSEQAEKTGDSTPTQEAQTGDASTPAPASANVGSPTPEKETTSAPSTPPAKKATAKAPTQSS